MQDDVEALLAVIREMGQSEKADIAAKAEEEVAKINRQGEAEIAQLQSEATARLEERLCTESAAIIKNAELKINSQLEHIKNTAIEKVFVLAKQAIQDMDGDARKETLKRLIGDAVLEKKITKSWQTKY